MQLIIDTPKWSELQSFFDWNLIYSELIKRLELYIPILELEDSSKEKIYLSWGMWKLAIQEWDFTTSLDTPIYKKEISNLKKYLKSYLFVNMNSILINPYYEKILIDYIDWIKNENEVIIEFEELIINMELSSSRPSDYTILLAKRELNIFKDFTRWLLFIN